MSPRRRILTQRQSLGGPFPQTRHSIVADLRSERAELRRAAYELLVAAYWKPVFKYIRLKWHADPDESADLTQGFFLRAFEKQFFANVRPSSILKRFIEPPEIANVVAFVCSPLASAINGAAVRAEGGVVLSIG